MADRTLLCEIVTPERIVYTNEVEMVVAPAIDGEIGIMPLHIPLVTVLAAGEIRVRHGQDQVEWFAVSGGYLQVHEDKVIILADAAVQASQIDLERAKQSRELLQARMQELKDKDAASPELDQMAKDLDWAEAQIQVGVRHSG